MLKISYAGCLSLSPAILAQFTLKMCVAAQNHEKNSLKPAILGVKGHSRSSMLTFLRRSSPELVVISSMSVPICNHIHTTLGNPIAAKQRLSNDYLFQVRQNLGVLTFIIFADA